METVTPFIFRLIHRAFNLGQSHSTTRRAREEARYAREKIIMLEQRPSPLPPARRKISQSSLATHFQPLSPLFTKLPPEIRQKIYELVLGGSVVHLVHSKRRITVHHRSEVVEDFDHEEQVGSAAIQEIPYLDWNSGNNELPTLDLSSQQSLSLLRTCHAIYTEAISVLYTSNVFTVSSPLVLIYLHDYILLPQRFSEIRHLNLYWTYFTTPGHFCGRIYAPYDKETWTRFWDLVAGMSLRSLGIRLEYWGSDEGRSMEAGWIQPLLKIKAINRVGLKIEHRVGPWTYMRLSEMERKIQKQWTTV